MLLDLIVIAMSGAAGSVARYLSYLAGRNLEPDSQFPLITLLVNVTGCLLIGVIMTFVERTVPFHRHLFLVGAVGFLGSFTTFSTFGFETLELMRTGHVSWAVISVSAQVIGGITAVWFGRTMAQWFT